MSDRPRTDSNTGTGTGTGSGSGTRTGTGTAPWLAERYGRAPHQRRRGRAAAILAGAVVLAATVAWVVWTGVGGATTSIEVHTQAFTLNDARTVTVHWLVSGRGGERLVCAIQAQAVDDTVVGLAEVVVPVTGSSDRSGTTTVRTTRAADSGLIRSCRDA